MTEPQIEFLDAPHIDRQLIKAQVGVQPQRLSFAVYWGKSGDYGIVGRRPEAPVKAALAAFCRHAAASPPVSDLLAKLRR